MKNRDELREIIYRGIKVAIERLISQQAKENDYLVVSRNGKIVKFPAKDLMPK